MKNEIQKQSTCTTNFLKYLRRDMEVRKMAKPEKRFSTGSLVASVWNNNGKSKNGEEIDFKTVSLQRRYKDKSGEWQSSNTLRMNDLPKASLLLQKAFEFLVMKEQAE